MAEVGADGRAPADIGREGLTILPRLPVAPGATPAEENVDIVFLHGLNGHPQNTWENKTTGFYWPAQLRKDIPGARVMVYGYNADFERALVSNETDIKTIAGMLVSRLIGKRNGTLKNRPLIVVAHSLGGLVIKRALVTIQTNRGSGLETREVKNQNALFDSITGLVFMGTPHAGSEVADMKRVTVLKAIAKAVSTKGPEKLMNALSAHSGELSDLTDRFEKTTIYVQRKIEICSYYELLSTFGVGERVVPPEMANLHYGNEIFEGISADHSNMVKFPNPKDDTYQTVMGRLQGMAEDSQVNDPATTHRVPQLPVHDPTTTYRVCQLPPDVNKDQLPAWLAKSAEGTGPAGNIRVFSLTTLSAIGRRPPTRTATLAFIKTPPMFHLNEMEWTFPKEDAGLSENIIIDIHFRGFTILNEVDPKEQTLDCIAISGLSSHPFGSWKQHNSESTFMWLRDKLTIDLKRVRVLLYGHDSHMAEDESTQTLEDIALSFMNKLDEMGQSSTAKNLVFIAHSLGGTVLKRALIGLANSSKAGENAVARVNQIFLFGVPSQGIKKIERLLPMVCEKPQGAAIPPIQNLLVDSPYVTELDKQFSGITRIHHIRLLSFYETKKTQTAKILGTHWELNGSRDVLVDKESAIQPSSNLLDRFEVNRDHLNLLRFTESDSSYQKIATNLHKLSETLDSQEVSISKKTVRAGQSGWTETFVEFIWRRGKSKDPDTEKNRTESTAYEFELAATTYARKNNIYLKKSDVSDRGRHLLNQDFENNEKDRQKTELLWSLEMEGSTDRFKDIDEAFPGTFEWIWSNPSLKFDNWLRKGQKTYWISGKPGSGKSTLMKVICTSSKTQSALDQRSSSRLLKQISAQFFFLNRGSYNQKSLDGLLHSLLHQILLADPRLIDIILPVFEGRDEDHGRYWSIPDLDKAFIALRDQKLVAVDILLTLDAIDEYDGPPENMANFIKTVTTPSVGSASLIRVCFSSRLWNQFDQFKDNDGLQIDEHTGRDLREYITGRLIQDKGTSFLLSDINTQTVSDWVITLATKAEGVFLYLKIVMDKIIDEHQAWLGEQTLTAQTKLAKLQELAETAVFPSNLEDFYYQLMDRIPRDYRHESYIMLELVLRHEGSIDLLTFHSIVECALAATLDESVEKASSGTKDRDLVVIWMKSRCGGMIELDPKEGTSPQFMHKSVKDFVAKAGFQWRILRPSYLLSGQNGYSFLARYGLSLLLASFKRKDPVPSPASWNKYMSYACQAEATTGKTQKELFYQVDDEVFRWAGAQDEFRYYFSMLSYAVTADLRLFVKANFDDGRVVDDPLRKSLLHCAVEATISHSTHRSQNRSAGPQKATFPSLSMMVEDLIDLGASRDSVFNGMTPFQLLFSDCFEGFGDGKGSVITENMLNVAKIFLNAGQDPNTTIRVTVRWWQRRHSSSPGDTLVVCMPLHVASSMEMIKLLLSAKASINALDSNKNTPLDIHFGEEDKLAATGEETSQNPAFHTAALLLSKGGCVNRTSQRTLDTFATVFKPELRQGLSVYATSKELKKPPRLKTGLFSRFGKSKSK